MNRAEWLNWRRTGLGGSDIAAVLGLSKWRTPWDVWADKKGLLPEKEETNAMRRGRLLESACATFYEEETGAKVEEVPSLVGPEPWMLGSLDRLAHHPNERETVILECKTARDRSDWGASGTEQVPIYYATQALWYMAVADIDECDFSTFFVFNDAWEIFTIHRDKEVEQAIIEATGDWWTTHVIGNEEPEIGQSSEASKFLADRFHVNNGETRTATDIEISMAKDYAAICETERDIRALKDAKANEIRQAIGDDTGFRWRGGRATWNTVHKSTFDTERFVTDHPDMVPGFMTIDTKALKKANPKLFKQYAESTPSTRRLLVRVSDT